MMKLGTVVKMSDGRIGTVIYHGVDGYGVVWGRRELKQDEREALLSGGLFTSPGDVERREFALEHGLLPEAMLRDEYPEAVLECVGDEYMVEEAPDA